MSLEATLNTFVDRCKNSDVSDIELHFLFEQIMRLRKMDDEKSSPAAILQRIGELEAEATALRHQLRSEVIKPSFAGIVDRIEEINAEIERQMNLYAIHKPRRATFAEICERNQRS